MKTIGTCVNGKGKVIECDVLQSKAGSSLVVVAGVPWVTEDFGGGNAVKVLSVELAGYSVEDATDSFNYTPEE